MHTTTDPADDPPLYRQIQTDHSMMLSKIFHEIRNPVTLINSLLQLLEKRHPGLANDTCYKSISENMDYLRLLLDDLSSFNNSGHIRPQILDLTQLFLRVIESVEPEFTENNISIQFHSAPDLPFLHADPVKIRQLLYNLLKNASEAIGCNGTITCSLYTRKNTVSFLIRDTGPGIPDEIRNSLFEPFITCRPDGTGLGLPVCKRIVEAHNGTISFQSCPLGTSFKITLPAG